MTSEASREACFDPLFDIASMVHASAATDVTPPSFTATPSAVASSRTSVDLSWDAATDNITPQGDIVYEIHWSTSAARPFAVRGKTTAGGTVFTAEDLRAGTTYYFRVRAVDQAGNSTESSEVGCSTTADASPAVTLVSPAQGEITADAVIVLRVADDLGLVAKVILVKYPDGTAEAAWDGSVFSAPFSLSTVTPISGGCEVRLVRTLGWPANPSVEVIAVDSAGQVV